MPEQRTGTARGAALVLVARSPVYIRATLSLFFAGLALAVALPQLSLFLVQELGASLPVAGMFFLTNLTAPVIGYLVGRRSDRLPDRLSLFRLGAVVGLVGWIAMAVSTQIWLVFVVNLTLLAFSGATSALVFAAVRDRLTETPTGADNRVMATVRLGFSVGFLVGPLVGSVLGAAVGLRWTLVVAGVCTLAQALPLLGRGAGRRVPVGSAPKIQAPTRGSLAPLVVFLGLSVLAMCGDTIRFAYLPLYMELQLGTPDWLRGAVISVQSAGMLVFIPLMGALADRFGAHRLVVVNVLLGMLANVGFATAGNELTLALATVLNAAMWATLGGIGITVAQDLYPSGLGTASSLYFSAIRFAAGIGGLVGAVGVGALGVPGIFWLPAALCLVAAAGLLVQAVVTSRRSCDSRSAS